MIKSILFRSISFAALLFVCSCGSDGDQAGGVDDMFGASTTVSLSAVVETSAATDTKASDYVLPTGYQLRTVVQVLESDGTLNQTLSADADGEFTSLFDNITLTIGKSYDILVWADIIESAGSGNSVYDVDDLTAVTYGDQGGYTITDPAIRDAFAGMTTITVKEVGNNDVAISLKRVLAKLNVINSGDITIRGSETVTITYPAGTPYIYNVKTGEISGDGNEIVVSGTTTAGDNNLLTDYTFAAYAMDIEYSLDSYSYSVDTPLQPNYETNVNIQFQQTVN